MGKRPRHAPHRIAEPDHVGDVAPWEGAWDLPEDVTRSLESLRRRARVSVRWSAAMNDRAARLDAAVHRLRDLRHGPSALAEVIALGETAIPALEALVRDAPGPISEHRRLAVRALRAIGTDAARGALERALADSIFRELDPVEREAEEFLVSDLAEALGALGARESADLLLRALAIRPNAGCAEALGVLGEARAVPLLVRCLADAAARASARGALVQFGRAAVPALSSALFPQSSPEELEGANSVLTRTVVAEVLGDIPGAASTEALSHALDDPRGAVRVAVALALARRGEEGDAAVPALAGACAGDRWDLAEAAAAALSAMGGEAALRAIAAAARRGETCIARQRAIRWLGRWPGIGAARALTELRDDPEPLVRDAAVAALAGRPEVMAREALEALARDPEPEIRRRAAAALGRGTGGVLRVVRSFLARRSGSFRWRHAGGRGGSA